MVGGHADKFKAPDWRQYKTAGISELETLQQMLAAKGLKDPWIRNEVWRYHPSNYCGSGLSGLKSFGRGLKYAVAAMALTILAEKMMKRNKPSDGHH
ncbi:hypothetical protein ScPMuIL_017019 [Solemya velum]